MRPLTLTGAPPADDWTVRAIREIDAASRIENPTTAKAVAAVAASLATLSASVAALTTSLAAKMNVVVRSTTQGAASAAFVDDTDLKVTMEANKIYSVRLVLPIFEGGGGAKIALNGPAGLVRLTASAAAALTVVETPAIVMAYDTAIFTATPGFGTLIACIEAIVVNGSTPGDLVARLAQQTLNATQTNFRRGARLEYSSIPV